MNIQWLRLWHDMPNDPKFKTVARLSGEPISLVISMFVHMMVDASRNVTRGHVTVTQEDLASALDVTESQIAAVIHSMQGRLLDGNYLLGWENRQVKREDNSGDMQPAKSSAQRKAEQRARQKEARDRAEAAGSSAHVTQSHAESRNVTLDKDKDKDKERGETRAQVPPVDNSRPPQISIEFSEVLKSRPDLNAGLVWENFCSHYPSEKQSLPRWKKWVETEHPGRAPPPDQDPDTRANVESMARAKGLPAWDETGEQWLVYRERVRAAPPKQPVDQQTKETA